jgi:beta-glucosidase/6-phospho-beta-glucosidase/beta-galactosidase
MEDINTMKTLGIKHFRMSISWSRVLPDGLASNPNPKGVLFY